MRLDGCPVRDMRGEQGKTVVVVIAEEYKFETKEIGYKTARKQQRPRKKHTVHPPPFVR